MKKQKKEIREFLIEYEKLPLEKELPYEAYVLCFLKAKRALEEQQLKRRLWLEATKNNLLNNGKI